MSLGGAVNGRVWAVQRLAEERVRERLLARSPIPAESLLDACELDQSQRENAAVLLQETAKIIGVEPGRFRASDVIDAVLRVDKKELSATEDLQAGWRQAGLQNDITVFVYDLMALVERLSARGRWKAVWRELSPRPADEEQWVDLILNMRLCEYLRFFSETMPRD